ncbi:cytochrome oxidase putative small subunit CydP [Iodobacter sp.]|uniref:cytochrome oxidase putative small subunit CydP n=1 Tax=Iodobacter sp. TaxID=1915058 RepID=UPI0025FE4A26|nr:cytochrome oxidase putative small subunit CydP [Iodobacter sp.]
MRINKRLPLWQEITVVLLIKMALLFAIWKCFFSEPVAKHMLVPQPMMTERFLGTASSPLPK